MAHVRAFLAQLGYASRITSTVRSFQKQASLFAAYRSGRSKYPAAPPGHSAHERGLAFDVAAPLDGLQQAGALAPLWGLRWGGDRDPVHFQAADA